MPWKVQQNLYIPFLEQMSTTTDISMVSTNQDQEIDIEKMYQDISPEAPDASSVAKWLEPIFSHHQSMHYFTYFSNISLITIIYRENNLSH